MSDKQLDDLFKTGLQGQRSDLPMDMWQRIVRQKDEDRKRLFFFWSLAGATAFIILAGSILWFNSDTNKHPAIVNNRMNKNSTRKGNGHPSVVNSARHEDTTVPMYEAEPKGKNIRVHHSIYASGQTTFRQINALGEENKMVKTNNKPKVPGPPNDPFVIISDTKNDTTLSQKEDSGTNNKKIKVDQSGTGGFSPKAKDSISAIDENLQTKKTRKKQQLDPRRWYLDFYLSPDYPLISGATDNPFCYTTGVKINRNLGGHLSVKLGIQYSQLNFIRSFDMPMLAGYSIGNEKWKITVNGGIVYNIYSWSNTDTLGTWIKKSTGFSLYAGINLERHINQTYSVFAEPYYRYRLSSMTISSAPFDEFIDVIGISFGLRVYFKR